MLRQPGAILLLSCGSVVFQGSTAKNRRISMVIILTPLTLFCNYPGSWCASQSCRERWGLTSLNLRSRPDSPSGNDTGSPCERVHCWCLCNILASHRLAQVSFLLQPRVSGEIFLVRKWVAPSHWQHTLIICYRAAGRVWPAFAFTSPARGQGWLGRTSDQRSSALRGQIKSKLGALLQKCLSQRVPQWQHLCLTNTLFRRSSY